MKEISRATYKRLGGTARRSSLADDLFGGPVTTETAWYVHNEFLGIVLTDNVDNDWSFVALAGDPRRPSGLFFRAFDVGTSYATPEQARIALAEAFVRGPDKSFFTEEVI